MPQIRALAIPEILQSVLKHADHASLFNCLSVNNFWFSEASRVLWDCAIDSEVLNSIEDVDRARYYASLTTGLVCCYAFDFSDKRILEFPKLQTLSVDVDKTIPLVKNLWAPYLVPSLTEFELYGGVVGDELLDDLLSKCPKLTKVLIDNPRKVTSAGLERFVSKCRAGTLTLLYGFEHCFSPEVFLRAASNEHLVDFGMPGVDKLTLQKVNLYVDEPFKNLERFTYVDEISIPEVKTLLATMHRLSEISLHRVDQVDQMLLAIIGNMQQLTLVAITGNRTPPTANTMNSLAKKFPNLRNIEIAMDGSTEASDVNDKCVSDFTERCKYLNKLYLNFQHNISCSGLTRIGLNCREMEDLEMGPEAEGNASIYLSEDYFRDEPTPLFPSLTSYEPHVELYALSRATLARHFPLIEVDFSD